MVCSSGSPYCWGSLPSGSAGGTIADQVFNFAMAKIILSIQLPMRAFPATVPGFRGLGAPNTRGSMEDFLGCVWVRMRLCITWVSRPIWAPFLIILDAKWAPFGNFGGSESGDFGVLGPPGGRLGAMLEPMAGPSFRMSPSKSKSSETLDTRL